VRQPTSNPGIGSCSGSESVENREFAVLDADVEQTRHVPRERLALAVDAPQNDRHVDEFCTDGFERLGDGLKRVPRREHVVDENHAVARVDAVQVEFALAVAGLLVNWNLVRKAVGALSNDRERDAGRERERRGVVDTHRLGRDDNVDVVELDSGAKALGDRPERLGFQRRDAVGDAVNEVLVPVSVDDRCLAERSCQRLQSRVHADGHARRIDVRTGCPTGSITPAAREATVSASRISCRDRRG
jgi:hypothetical protein